MGCYPSSPKRSGDVAAHVHPSPVQIDELPGSCVSEKRGGRGALPRLGPVAVGVVVDGEVEADVIPGIGGQIHLEVRRERDVLTGEARTFPGNGVASPPVAIVMFSALESVTSWAVQVRFALLSCAFHTSWIQVPGNVCADAAAGARSSPPPTSMSTASAPPVRRPASLIGLMSTSVWRSPTVRRHGRRGYVVCPQWRIVETAHSGWAKCGEATGVEMCLPRGSKDPGRQDPLCRITGWCASPC